MNSHTHTGRHNHPVRHNLKMNSHPLIHNLKILNNQTVRHSMKHKKTPCKDKDKDVDKDIHPESESPTVNRSQRSTNRDAENVQLKEGKVF